MTYSVRNIVIAVVLAVLAAVLVIMYTSNAQNQANKGQTSVTVLVAKTDIAPGTSVRECHRSVFPACDLARAAPKL